MSEIVREIASQPACWREAAARAPDLRRVLPTPGQRVAAIGCGTSLYVAQAFAGLREARGLGETDAFPASEFPIERPYDLVLAISRSGTTTEVARLLGRIPDAGDNPTAAISAVDATPVVSAAGSAAILEFADERSVVQTRFATTALALLRTHLGEDIEPVIADSEAALTQELPVNPAAFDHYVFLGRGWTVGLAHEAALKFREAAGAWTESYPALEYRHGPISVAGPTSVVWALGKVEPELLDDAAKTGATVVADGLDPLAELVLIQRAAVALAESRWLDPDHPRYLTRSVVLS